MHATAVDDPRAVKAAPTVLYSPERVPLPLTVKHPEGGLVRPALFCSRGVASMKPTNKRMASKKLGIYLKVAMVLKIDFNSTQRIWLMTSQ